MGTGWDHHDEKIVNNRREQQARDQDARMQKSARDDFDRQNQESAARQKEGWNDYYRTQEEMRNNRRNSHGSPSFGSPQIPSYDSSSVPQPKREPMSEEEIRDILKGIGIMVVIALVLYIGTKIVQGVTYVAQKTADGINYISEDLGLIEEGASLFSDKKGPSRKPKPVAEEVPMVLNPGLQEQWAAKPNLKYEITPYQAPQPTVPISQDKAIEIYSGQMRDSFSSQRIGVVLSDEEQARAVSASAGYLAYGVKNMPRLSRVWLNGETVEMVVSTAPYSQEHARSLVCVSENSEIKGLFRVMSYWDHGKVRTSFSSTAHNGSSEIDLADYKAESTNCSQALQLIQNRHHLEQLEGLQIKIP